MTVTSTLESIVTSLEGVAGLRPQLSHGAVNVPAALVELATISTPSAFGGSADYTVNVVLMLQLGEYRNIVERFHTLVEPEGSTTTSAVAALLANGAMGTIQIQGPRLIDYGGQSYGGGVITVTVVA